MKRITLRTIVLSFLFATFVTSAGMLIDIATSSSVAYGSVEMNYDNLSHQQHYNVVNAVSTGGKDGAALSFGIIAGVSLFCLAQALLQKKEQ